MSDFYLGEIRVFPFAFAPTGWHLCDGSLLQIQQNTALYSLLGLQYGGNGTTTFGLPDLRGRTAIDIGQQSGASYYQIGNNGGSENVTLNATQMPAHNHLFFVKNGVGNVNEPANILAIPSNINTYNNTLTGQHTLNTASVATVGGNTAHQNMQPFLTLNFCIAVTGLYPTRP